MFLTDQKVGFFDADPAGIMFFANIFRMAHAAYEEVLNSKIPDRNYFLDDELAIPIVHSEADYFLPLKPGDVVTPEVSPTVIKESSFELTFTFRNKAGSVCARVRTVHVVVDKNSWTRVTIPADLMNCLADL